ncbi:rhomboid family intramembrane serine protease [Phormidium tenue FACHB-886]|nr:rhomboid family intramembrane serine protease [Phormidium tenue FACHB-886]
MAPSAEDLILIRAQARLILGLVAIAWLVHLLNWVVGYRLNWLFSLRPRTLWGFVCIPLVSFLHVNWRHLISNTKAFLLLGWFIAAQGIHLFYATTIAIALLGGLLTWLIADGRGVGASILIYGYISFLIIYGIAAGEGIALLLAIVTALEYQYNILGRMRFGQRMWVVGWLSTGDRRLDRLIGNSGCYGHFAGLLAGIVVAYGLGLLKLS